MPSPYSYSSLSMFERCPQQYAHKYVWKTPVPEMPLDLYMTCGSVVHSVLENAHQAVLEKGGTISKEQALEMLPQIWKDMLAQSAVPISPEELTPFIQKSSANVNWYFDTHFEAEKVATIGVEKKLLYPLNPRNKQWIIGFVDRVSQPDEGKIILHDYKTGSKKLSNKSLGKDFQATLYGGMAAHTYKPLREIELQWHYLSHEKTVKTVLDPEAARSAVQKAQTLANGIEGHKQAQMFPPKVGFHCKSCEFISHCPAHK